MEPDALVHHGRSTCVNAKCLLWETAIVENNLCGYFSNSRQMEERVQFLSFSFWLVKLQQMVTLDAVWSQVCEVVWFYFFQSQLQGKFPTAWDADRKPHIVPKWTSWNGALIVSFTIPWKRKPEQFLSENLLEMEKHSWAKGILL